MELFLELAKQSPLVLLCGILFYLLKEEKKDKREAINRSNALSDKILEVLPKLTSIVNNSYDIIKKVPYDLKESVDPIFQNLSKETAEIKDLTQEIRLDTGKIEGIVQDIKEKVK